MSSPIGRHDRPDEEVQRPRPNADPKSFYTNEFLQLIVRARGRGVARRQPRDGRRRCRGLIELEGVSKIFGSGPAAVHAFGPVDLDIEPGEFVSLLGPSGCGKSTLMLMLAGLMPCTTGVIRVGGRAVTGPQTDIGIMFQDNTLVPWRTVRGNIELQLELRGLPVAKLRRAGREPARLGAPRRLRRPLPLRAFGRHAAARRLLPGDGARAADHAARRAARKARRHDPREHPPRPAGALDAAAADGGLRHALHRGGDPALDAGSR